MTPYFAVLALASLPAFAVASSDPKPSPSPPVAAATFLPYATPAPSPAPHVTASSALTPVPAPISTSLVEDPAISQRAREWLLRLQANQIDRSQIDAKFNASLTPAIFKKVSQQITAFGTLVSFTFLRSSTYPEGVVYEYAAHFATTPGVWYFAVDTEGKIGGMQILSEPH